MTSAPCPREPELLTALGRGFVGPDLASHAAGCPACGELQLVAQALLADRETTVREVRVPAAATTWWRLRLRQRREAEAQARRTLLVGQAATGVAALALVVALFGAELLAAVRAVTVRVPGGGPLALGLGVVGLLVLLVPLAAGWVALRER